MDIKFPKIFVSPPYWKCPNCNTPDNFGVLMICNRHYIRRCKECNYDSNYSLPELCKKVIYIDQFAISNMMKVLNSKTKAYKKGTINKFWLNLFERLDSLCKLQLIICPDSGFHTCESLLSPYFEPLKRMYELLSHGVTFYNRETIERVQIYEHADNWISGKENKELSLDVQSVISGEINAWQDRLIISINQKHDLDWIDGFRKVRKTTHKELSEVFRSWQSEKDKTFHDWFEEESKSFARITLQIYLSYMKRFEEITMGHVKLTENDVFPPPSITLVRFIHYAFKETGISAPDIWPKTIEYLTSSSLKEVPFIKISSMLYAALARKAAAGRKRPPNLGMANDIAIISVLLPYCDAMFIDNECHTYLQEKPLCDAINYGTITFSQNTKEEFLNYLDKIEQKASKKHLDKVEKVYGENWKKPYTTLYKNDSSDTTPIISKIP